MRRKGDWYTDEQRARLRWLHDVVGYSWADIGRTLGLRSTGIKMTVHWERRKHKIRSAHDVEQKRLKRDQKKAEMGPELFAFETKLRHSKMKGEALRKALEAERKRLEGLPKGGDDDLRRDDARLNRQDTNLRGANRAGTKFIGSGRGPNTEVSGFGGSANRTSELYAA